MHFWRKSVRALKVAAAFGISLTELALRRPKNRAARAAWLSKFCRRVLRAGNVTCSTSGPIPLQGAVITNHLSYMDILVHASLRPCVFVAAVETRKMPLIGWISMMAGTVYVARGAGGSAAKAAGGMDEGFRDHLPVVFFPEGGTGLGDQPLLPLHSGLLATAIEAQAPVTPGFLRYSLSSEDLAEGRSPRADVHWGKRSLPSHLWNFFGLGAVHAHFHFANGPIPFSAAALADRKVATEEARIVIVELSQPLPDHALLQPK